MRYIVGLCLLTLAAPVFAGSKKNVDLLPKNDEGRYYLEGVVQIPEASADELYQRARIWFVHEYRSANAVIQYEDQAEHRLIGKGVFDIPYGLVGPIGIQHTITVETKDGRYRYEIRDLFQLLCDCTVEKWGLGKKKIATGAREIAADLKKAMEAPATDEDW